MIKHYPSIAALRQDWIDHAKGYRERPISTNLAWHGGETVNQTEEFSLVGDKRLVPEAEALIRKLTTEINVPKAEWIPSPAGAYPIIPDHLRGLPTSMRRRVEIQNDRSAINIYLCVTSSAGVNAKILTKRGVTVLALALAMTRIRPVKLSIISIIEGKDNGETVITAEINTHPIDLATACYALTSQGFSRRLTYEVCNWLNIHRTRANYILWPHGFDYFKPEKYYEYLTRAFGLKPETTLFIPPVMLHDEEIVSRPVEWINGQIRKFNLNQEERS
jgi:hypothetical protein